MLPQLLAFHLEQLGGISVLQHFAVFGNAIGGAFLRNGRSTGQQCQSGREDQFPGPVGLSHGAPLFCYLSKKADSAVSTQAKCTAVWRILPQLPPQGRVRPVLAALLPSAHRGFIGSRLSLVVLPGHRYLVARLGAFDDKLQKRVLRYRGPPFSRQHGLAIE
ncbi:hypothetical protein D3C71_1733630 [compost metagenome]